MNDTDRPGAPRPAAEILQLLMEIDWYESQPELYYHRILESAIDLIPEARWGTVSLTEDGRWRYIACVGHDLAGLLSLDLKAEWDLSGPQVVKISGIETLHGTVFPPEVQTVFRRSIRKTCATLIGAYDLGRGRKVSLTVDIPEGSGEDFSEESLKTFQAFLKLAGQYQAQVEKSRDLESLNHTLEVSYHEVTRLSDKLKQVLNLSGELGEDGHLDQFFSHLLQGALEVIDQADYGSVSVIDGENWQFLASVGHDLKALQALKLKAQYIHVSPEVTVVEDLLHLDRGLMPGEVWQDFSRASRPIRSSLVVNLPVDERLTVNLTLDIRRESTERFTAASRKIFTSFARMATGYLRIRVHNEVMRKAYQGFAHRLALMAEAQDPETGRHNQRVARLSGLLARWWGLPAAFCEEIEVYAGLHDIGKVFLDSRLLHHQGPLTVEEFSRVQNHTTLAVELLDDPFFLTARNIALCHHEKWDGRGYPRGLKGDMIPKEAQVVALADVFDALRCRRPYKDAMDLESTLEVLRRGDGRVEPGHFNPGLLEVLMAHAQEIEEQIYSIEE